MLSLSMPWRHLQEVVVLLHSFLTLALDGHQSSTLCPGLFTPGKDPWHTLNGRPPTAGLNIMEISWPCQESNPRPSTFQPSHYNCYAFMAPGCFQTLQNTGGSGSVNKVYLIIYIGRYIIVTLVRFKCALLPHHMFPTFLWQRAKPAVVGWFAGRMWTNSSQWYT